MPRNIHRFGRPPLAQPQTDLSHDCCSVSRQLTQGGAVARRTGEAASHGPGPADGQELQFTCLEVITGVMNFIDKAFAEDLSDPLPRDRTTT